MATRRARRRTSITSLLTALALIATMFLGTNPAAAGTEEGGNWDAPPTCFKDGAQVHKTQQGNGKYLMGIYTYAFEYNYRRYYGNGYETRYIWVYEVQNPMGGVWEMMTVGWAHKLCGGTWTQTSSNIA